MIHMIAHAIQHLMRLPKHLIDINCIFLFSQQAAYTILIFQQWVENSNMHKQKLASLKNQKIIASIKMLLKAFHAIKCTFP